MTSIVDLTVYIIYTVHVYKINIIGLSLQKPLLILCEIMCLDLWKYLYVCAGHWNALASKCKVIIIRIEETYLPFSVHQERVL